MKEVVFCRLCHSAMSDCLSKICCSQHPDEECTFVCVDCVDLICDDCIDLVVHSGHDVKSVKKFIKEVDLDELKNSCENVDCNGIQSKITEEAESRFIKAIDSIEERATKLKSEIDAMKEKKLEECKEMQAKNSAVIHEVVSLVDPTDILEKINNLPATGGRTQYAQVAHALLKYQKTIDSDEFEVKTEASVFLPTFTKGKMQKTRLEKMFGELDFEEESVNDICVDIEDSSDECGSSDEESNENVSSENEGLNDFVGD